MKNVVYDYVTERILGLLDKGEVPWHKPWDADSEAPRNFVSKKPYRGINTFLLSFSGFSSPYWLTMNQCRAKGGKVKKGSKSHMIVFYQTLEYADKTDKDKINKIPFLRYFNVFNVEQCEGLTLPESKKVEREFVPIEEAARIVREMPLRPTINHGGNRACYSAILDTISMPMQNTFDKPQEYYCTVFHELAHSTGHESRLKRFEKASPASMFGSESYSKEELVAEMTAAFLCATIGIENSTIDNSAAYIQQWRNRISADPKLVVQAANQAQKAADYILNKPKEEEKKEEAAE